jgi:hypothetical protein
MRFWEELVFDVFRLTTLVLAIAVVLLVEILGVVNMARSPRDRRSRPRNSHITIRPTASARGSALILKKRPGLSRLALWERHLTEENMALDQQGRHSLPRLRGTRRERESRKWDWL